MASVIGSLESMLWCQDCEKAFIRMYIFKPVYCSKFLIKIDAEKGNFVYIETCCLFMQLSNAVEMSE